MKNKLHNALSSIMLFLITTAGFAQMPTLGTVANFALFTQTGALVNAGSTIIQGGAIGTNAGAITGFTNVICEQHIQNTQTVQCAEDLVTLFNEIHNTAVTEVLTAVVLTGAFTAGVYRLSGAVTIAGNDTVTLDAQNNPDAVFIFNVTGAFTTGSRSMIILINGANAQRVFWNIDGAITINAGASVKGTFISLAGEVTLCSASAVEGRAMSIAGVININNCIVAGCMMSPNPTVIVTEPTCLIATGDIEITSPLGYTYTADNFVHCTPERSFLALPAGEYNVFAKNTEGCISWKNVKLHDFNHNPNLGLVTDFVLFTTAGALGNTATTVINGGAIGTNYGAITNFQSPVPSLQYVENAITLQCSSDLLAAFTAFHALTPNAELLDADLPLGGPNTQEVYTKGVYHCYMAVTLTTQLTLDAQGDPSAMFVFQITGALWIAAVAQINLINGAIPSNVYWIVDGAVGCGAGAHLEGTFLAHEGAIALGAGATVNGRLLTIAGAITTYGNVLTGTAFPSKPIVTVVHPTAINPTGTITITEPTGMFYSIDGCTYENTTGIFTGLPDGTYNVTAKSPTGTSNTTTVMLLLPATVWISSLNPDWNVADNWNPSGVPTGLVNVTVSDVSPFSGPTVNQSTDLPALCHDLTIESSASLTIAAGKALSVKGIFTNYAGNIGLVIQSTANGTGSLIHNTANVDGTVERYIPAAVWGTWNDGWHFLTSPVADHAITGAFTVIPADEYDFYAWSEKYNEWINFKETVAPFFTDADVNGSTTFGLGKSYMAAYKTTDTKTFSGILNVADASVIGLGISTGINRSWHLIGNPFTSALTWDETIAWNKINIGGVANIWNEAGRSYTPCNAGDPIPAGNGFMVQASGGGSGSFTIPAVKRVHSAQDWYKNSDYPVVKLFAHNLDDPSFQESQIRFNPQSTSDFDLEFDSDFLPGYAPLFYSKIDGLPTSVNSLPALVAETVIPFSFIKNEGTNFSIEATGLESLGQTAIYLRDTKLRINHNLSENPVYTFTSFAGDAPERFELRFGTTGIGETSPQINAWVYDNMLYVNNPDGNTLIEVFDLTGKRLLITQLSDVGLQSLPLHQPTGLYLIRLTSKGKIQTIKANVNNN